MNDVQSRLRRIERWQAFVDYGGLQAIEALYRANMHPAADGFADILAKFDQRHSLDETFLELSDLLTEAGEEFCQARFDSFCITIAVRLPWNEMLGINVKHYFAIEEPRIAFSTVAA